MNYTGYFINLDRSTERRTEMEAQLDQLQLRDTYQRLAAADGRTHLHILEDDVALARQSADVVN